MSYTRPGAARSTRMFEGSPARPVGLQAPELRRRQLPLTRRYEISYLDDLGEIQDTTRIAPALPVFEEAFSAFAHGVILNTASGPVAIEDILPGDTLMCASGRLATVRWKGAITLVPGAPTITGEPEKLCRVTPDAFGLSRPSRDVVLGPSARRLDRDATVRAVTGTEAAMVPLSAQADGVSVIQVTPATPVRVYHRVTDRHEAVVAGGLEIETYHPGPDAAYSLSSEMRELFLQLFPHVNALGDFGRLLWPRLTSDDLLAV